MVGKATVGAFLTILPPMLRGLISMTQMLLFDFPTTVASPVPSTSCSPASSASCSPVPVTAPGPSRQAADETPAAASPVPLCSGSLPLYDPAQGELHRIGDLAQLVLARYEIVHRRRAARLRRAQAQAACRAQAAC